MEQNSSHTSNFKIGKRIVEIKQDTKKRASYGEKILEQLSKDLNNKYKKGFSESNLQYMKKFFIYYRNSKFYSELTWSHYISLLQIEDKKTRQRLERIAIQKKLSIRDLSILVKNKTSKSKVNIPIQKKSDTLAKPILKLFRYRLIQFSKQKDTELIPHLDLGFSILTKQRLRLREIATAELTTKRGLSAKKYIEQELKDCRFIIIKTYSKDKYDRYLVDVFYLKNTTDEKKIISPNFRYALLSKAHSSLSMDRSNRIFFE